MRVVDAVRIELRFQTDTAAGAVENAVLTRDIQVISAVQLKSGPVGDDRQLPSGSGIAQNGGWISGKNKVVAFRVTVRESPASIVVDRDRLLPFSSLLAVTNS